MVTHSSTLVWELPWTEEPDELQSMGSQRVGHDWVNSLSLFTFMHWRRKWQPTPVFLPGESQDGGAWWAAVYEVAQSRTWLMRLSSIRIHKLQCWNIMEYVYVFIFMISWLWVNYNNIIFTICYLSSMYVCINVLIILIIKYYYYPCLKETETEKR